MKIEFEFFQPQVGSASITARSAQVAWRVLRLLNYFRILIPLMLGALQLATHHRPYGDVNPILFSATLTVYALSAVVFFFSIRHQWLKLQTQTQLQFFIDILAISLLTYSSGGMKSGLAELMILPVTAAPLILERTLGYGLTALGALALLTQQVLIGLHGLGDTGDLTTAAMLGALMFILSIGASHGLQRLRHNESLVKQREVDIANLAELNEFIVRRLRESIMVVDAENRIRLINDSASKLLAGGSVTLQTDLAEIAPALLGLLNQWREAGMQPLPTTATIVSSNGATLIQPHFVALSSNTLGGTLIFLEDTSIVAQQVKQSKLAALGHLSASIAHEVRNPVGAMSHATQLLMESPNLDASDQRLCNIISSNSQRVSRIIDNILQLSRHETIQVQTLSLNNWVDEFATQFQQTFQLSDEELQINHPDYSVDVKVDASHLSQIVSNLLENALKYGQQAGSKWLEIHYGYLHQTHRPYLEVADRGAGIPADRADHIFEPFFSLGGEGSGLGLFIARELAQCNGAMLIYEPRQGGGSIFRISFFDPKRWEK